MVFFLLSCYVHLLCYGIYPLSCYVHSLCNGLYSLSYVHSLCYGIQLISYVHSLRCLITTSVWSWSHDQDHFIQTFVSPLLEGCIQNFTEIDRVVQNEKFFEYGAS